MKTTHCFMVKVATKDYFHCISDLVCFEMIQNGIFFKAFNQIDAYMLCSNKELLFAEVQCLVPTLTNGIILSGNQAFVDYDTVLPLACDTPSYRLVGNPTITCQYNMTFSTPPLCEGELMGRME